MNRKFINLISEHTFWKDQAEKDKFLKSKQDIADSFWSNYIGFAALYQADKDYALLKQYFKADQVRLTAIKDTNQDLTYIIKILVDEKMMTPSIGNELTRFLALLKQGKITSIDEVQFRKMISKVKLTKVPPSPILKKIIRDFIGGKTTLQQSVPPVFRFSKRNKLNTEFVHMARKMMPHVDTDPASQPDESDATKPNTLDAKVAAKKDAQKTVLKPTTKQKAQAVITGISLDAEFKNTKTNKAFKDMKITKLETVDDLMVLALQVWDKQKAEIKKILKSYNWDNFGGEKEGIDVHFWSAAAKCIANRHNITPRKNSKLNRELFHAWNNIQSLNRDINGHFNQNTLNNIFALGKKRPEFYNEFSKAFMFSSSFDPLNVDHLTMSIAASINKFDKENTTWNQIRSEGLSLWVPVSRDYMKTDLGDMNIVWTKIINVWKQNPDGLINTIYKVKEYIGNWILSKGLDKWDRQSFEDWQHYIINILSNDKHTDEYILAKAIKAVRTWDMSVASKLYSKNASYHNSTEVKKQLNKMGLLGKDGFTQGVKSTDLDAKEFLNSKKFLELVKGFVSSKTMTLADSVELTKLTDEFNVNTVGMLLIAGDRLNDFLKELPYQHAITVNSMFGATSPLSRLPEIHEQILDWYLDNAASLWVLEQDAQSQPCKFSTYDVEQDIDYLNTIKGITDNSAKFKKLLNTIFKPFISGIIMTQTDYYDIESNRAIKYWLRNHFGEQEIVNGLEKIFDAFSISSSYKNAIRGVIRLDTWAIHVTKEMYLSDSFQDYLIEEIIKYGSISWDTISNHKTIKLYNHWGFTKDSYIDIILKEIDKATNVARYNDSFVQLMMDEALTEPKPLADKMTELRKELFESDDPGKISFAFMVSSQNSIAKPTPQNLSRVKETKNKFTKKLYNILEEIQGPANATPGKTKYSFSPDDESTKEDWKKYENFFTSFSNQERKWIEIFNNTEIFSAEESRQIKSLIVGITNNSNSNRNLQKITIRDIKLDIKENPTDYDSESSLLYLNRHFKLGDARFAWTDQSRTAIEADVMGAMGDLLYNVYSDKKQKDNVNDIIDSYKSVNKHSSIYKRLKDKAFISPLVEGIVGSDVAIKPLTKLSPSELMHVLRWNNFDFASSIDIKFYKRKNEKYTDYLDRIIAAKEDINFEPPPLKIKEIELSLDEQEEMSGEYLQYYSPNFKHGNTGLKFIKTFEVHLPEDTFEEFKEKKKDASGGIIIPAFHGTGSVAASMILRFGFKIVTKSMAGVEVTGKMLGDGVYFSNIIDKAAQYLGDSGYSRRNGTIGYIFEMEAVAGENGTDYRVAGLGGDNIRSPEWAVFNPRAQLRIYRAHMIEIVPRTRVKEWAKKHKKTVVERKHFNHLLSFNQYSSLNEDSGTAYKGTNVIEFQFLDGNIPSNKNVVTQFDKWAKDNKNSKVSVEISTLGPVVVIKTQLDLSGRIVVDDTDDFCTKNPEGLRDQFLTLIENSK